MVWDYRMVIIMVCKLDELLRNHAALVGVVSELAQLRAYEILGQLHKFLWEIGNQPFVETPWGSLNLVSQLKKT